MNTLDTVVGMCVLRLGSNEGKGEHVTGGYAVCEYVCEEKKGFPTMVLIHGLSYTSCTQI